MKLAREGKGEDADSDTPFVNQFDEFSQRIDLWNQLEQLDAVTGIGHYGVMVIGIRDGKNLIQQRDRFVAPGRQATARYTHPDSQSHDSLKPHPAPIFGL